MTYAGLYKHDASDLYLATYRAYNSATAHWLNRDPIREAGGLNVYAYVGGDPVNYIDPKGLYFSGGMFGGSISGQAGGSYRSAGAGSAAVQGTINSARDSVSFNAQMGVNTVNTGANGTQYGLSSPGVGVGISICPNPPHSDDCDRDPFTDNRVGISVFGTGANWNPGTNEFCLNIGIGIGIGIGLGGSS